MLLIETVEDRHKYQQILMPHAIFYALSKFANLDDIINMNHKKLTNSNVNIFIVFYLKKTKKWNTVSTKLQVSAKSAKESCHQP